MIILAFLSCFLVIAQRGPPQLPKIGAAISGKYRNMFREAGYKQEDIDSKIDAAFQQLYYGNPTDQAIYYEVDDDTAYVTDVKNNDVRTEGMGYGMMVMVQMNKQHEFDRIWAWVKKHMFHSNMTDKLYGWSAWHCRRDGQIIGNGGPAPDGETWFITSLYFAAARWGDISGRYNYTEEANIILTAVTTKQEPQNMFEPNVHIVRFDPSTTFTDPSYFTPAFYPVWALKTNHTPHIWNKTAETTRNVLFASVNSTTGLSPNQCSFNGGIGGHVPNFEEDAWRTARNWALDYSWWADDLRQIQLSNTIHTFFSNIGIGKYGDHYMTNGTETRSMHSPGLAAMNAVAALASNQSLAWEFIDALWNESIPTGDARDSDRYFSGSLYLEALLMLSGNYRVWL